MLIQVEYRNRRYDMVQDYYLEALLAAGQLRRFRRNEGWVQIGSTPLRGSHHPFVGRDRRNQVVHRPLGLPVRLGGKQILPVFGGQYFP